MRAAHLPPLAALTLALLGPGAHASDPTERAPTPLPRPGLNLPPQKVWAVTPGSELISFRVNAPDTVLSRQPLRGLRAGDRLIGVDFRVARGQLYGLGQRGQLYRIDPATAQAEALGDGLGTPLGDEAHGLDINPTVDRVRVVARSGRNLRLHPDTGAQVDGNPQADGVQDDAPLRYADGDPATGQPPGVVAAGYTYHKTDPKQTTNYAIDATHGTLVIQGSREDTWPVVSPNTGLLTTVGPLGLGPLADASFDINDTDNRAYLAATTAAGAGWYQVDLGTGQARWIGRLPDVLSGIALAP